MIKNEYPIKVKIIAWVDTEINGANCLVLGDKDCGCYPVHYLDDHLQKFNNIGSEDYWYLRPHAIDWGHS